MVLVFAVALIGGCATADQVEGIVDRSNRDIVVASIRENSIPSVGGASAELDPGTQGGSVWREVVTAIEEFCAAHPEELRTINALRIRQAVILLNAKQKNLARVAFADVDRAQLGNARDVAIYDAREHLIWWFGFDDSMSASDRVAADAAIAALDDIADDQESGSGIRFALEEMRIRIALRVAQTLRTESQVRAVLDEPIDRYGKQFDWVREAVQLWHLRQDLAPGTTFRSLRWYQYPPDAFARADDIMTAVCTGQCETYNVSRHYSSEHRSRHNVMRPRATRSGDEVHRRGVMRRPSPWAKIAA